MKKYLVVFLLLLSVKYIVAQENPTLEEEFKSYILSHAEDYDPIVGIYSMGGHMDKWVQGSLVLSQDMPVSSYKVAIIRKGSSFYEYTLPAEDQEKYRIIAATSTPNMYIKNGEIISLNSSSKIEMCRWESQENLAQMINGTIADVNRLQFKIQICTDYIKVFPTKWDIENAIKKQNKELPSSATGFALSSDGYIVTNYHVIENAKSIKVKGVNQNFQYSMKAEVSVVDKNNDLAIIKVVDQLFSSFGTIPYIISYTSDDVGESVYILGYPLTASMGDELKLTDGLISAKSGFKGDITSYQISAAAQPGNSGGPLFDKNGNLIGIVNAKNAEAENATYAVKSNYLINLIESLNTKPVLQKVNSLAGKTLTDQVKLIKNFVFIIEVN